MKKTAPEKELIDKIRVLEETLAQNRKVEEKLRESEQIYRMILEKSFAGIYVVQDGIFRAVNPNAASYAGYTIGELIGKKSDSILHPEDRRKVKEDARDMLRGKRQSPYDFRILTKQGEIRWIMEMVTSIYNEGRPAILGNSMDITELKLAEEKLRQSENFYRAIFENTGMATIIIEEDTVISLINTEFEKISGYSRKEWENKKSWTEFVAGEDRERMVSYHRMRRADPGSAPRNYEFHFIDSRGRILDVVLTVAMIPGTKKSVASFADVTEFRLAEKRLKESETLYRTIFETTGTATMIIEEDMTISLVNSEFEKLSRAGRDYWEEKRKWPELVAKKDLGRMKGYHRLRRVDPESAPRNYEFGLIDRKGNQRDILITIAMIPGTAKSVASLTDITERKKAEEILRKREQEVQIKSRSLEEVNTALKVLLKQREEDRREMEDKMIGNLKSLVLPYLDRAKKTRVDKKSHVYLNILETNLLNILSPFTHSLSSRHISLTPREIQVASLVKEGKTSKEIADIIGICTGAVSLHRNHIRKKLGLKHKKINLTTYLDSLG